MHKKIGFEGPAEISLFFLHTLFFESCLDESWRDMKTTQSKAINTIVLEGR